VLKKKGYSMATFIVNNDIMNLSTYQKEGSKKKKQDKKNKDKVVDKVRNLVENGDYGEAYQILRDADK
jgi:hypothetical protein